MAKDPPNFPVRIGSPTPPGTLHVFTVTLDDGSFLTTSGKVVEVGEVVVVSDDAPSVASPVEWEAASTHYYTLEEAKDTAETLTERQLIVQAAAYSQECYKAWAQQDPLGR